MDSCAGLKHYLKWRKATAEGAVFFIVNNANNIFTTSICVVSITRRILHSFTIPLRLDLFSSFHVQICLKSYYIVYVKQYGVNSSIK